MHALFDWVNGFFYPILRNFSKLSVTFGHYVHKNVLKHDDLRKYRRSEIHIYDGK